MLTMNVTFAMVMSAIDYFVRAAESLSLQRYLDVGASIALAIYSNLLVVYGDLARIANGTSSARVAVRPLTYRAFQVIQA